MTNLRVVYVFVSRHIVFNIIVVNIMAANVLRSSPSLRSQENLSMATVIDYCVQHIVSLALCHLMSAVAASACMSLAGKKIVRTCNGSFHIFFLVKDQYNRSLD
jgi:hypothetical protein